MKKTFFTSASLVLATVALVLTGCQKKDLTPKALKQTSETNVRLVPEAVAREIATGFNADSLYGSNKGTNHYPFKNTLHGNNVIKSQNVLNDSYGNPAIYIYNFDGSAGGFLFMSADSGMQPILAFIEHGEFKKDIVPSGLLQWANTTLQDIELVRKGLYDNSKAVKDAWGVGGLVNSSATPSSTSGFGQGGIILNNAPGTPPPNCQTTNYYNVYTVGPFLPTTWGQECTYNEQCGAPGVNYNCNDVFDCTTRPCTGCVATSTAQIINYWHPTNQYGYNYASMPATNGNAEVQRLMRDIGLPANVNMQYGCNNNGGSAADGGTVPAALKNNFGFASANYAGYDYNTVLNNITNNLWPVLLDGCATMQSHWFVINWWTSLADCHEWVCDGYTTTSPSYTSSCSPGNIYYGTPYNIMFHMNWGWHEVIAANDFNGWFAVNNWTITGAAPGGANYNFQYANGMTTEIHP